MSEVLPKKFRLYSSHTPAGRQHISSNRTKKLPIWFRLFEGHTLCRSNSSDNTIWHSAPVVDHPNRYVIYQPDGSGKFLVMMHRRSWHLWTHCLGCVDVTVVSSLEEVSEKRGHHWEATPRTERKDNTEWMFRAVLKGKVSDARLDRAWCPSSVFYSDAGIVQLWKCSGESQDKEFFHLMPAEEPTVEPTVKPSVQPPTRNERAAILIAELTQERKALIAEVRHRFSSIVGMSGMEKTLLDYVSFIFNAKLRAKLNNKPMESLGHNHVILTGPPGTGKTMMAEVIASMMHRMGLLQSGECLVVSAKDLISEHIGGTAPKTAAKIKEARGGMLFIDEAYMLAPKSERDFGPEAVAELLTAMEANSISVCIAGYEWNIEELLKSNEGFRSRFPQSLHFQFEGYSCEDLSQIFVSFVKREGYSLTDAAKAQLPAFFARTSEISRAMGNGRFARECYDSARRVAGVRTTRSLDDGTLTVEDVVDRGALDHITVEDLEAIL